MDAGGGRRIGVVTGGSGSLGRGVVEVLVDRGWTLHVPWIREGETEALDDRLGARMEAVHLTRCDVTDPAEVEAFTKALEERHGGIELLCNLVGGFAMGSLAETDPATWHRMMEINATSAFLCTRAALPLLRAGAGHRDEEGGDGDGDRFRTRGRAGASVVNVAALPPLQRGGDGMSAYTASKAGVVALTRALGEELREDGIRVNAVAPEIIDTGANREAMPDADRSTWLQPREIARVIAFLADPDSAVVTGSVLELKKG
jgi:NAD(P)-dependent dehydrogenase (short-subunit alcohol dehydrogenase family)